MNTPYINILSKLPEAQRKYLPKEPPEGLQEIRLAVGAEIGLVISGRSVVLAGSRLGETQLLDCFYGLCENAVYAYEQELAQGYFTVNSCRVGVAGKLLYREGKPSGFRQVTGLNIRIPRDTPPPLAVELREFLLGDGPGGLLIVGPPGSGKTTLLRAVGICLAENRRRFAVVDEKSELSSGIALQSPFCFAYTECARQDGILYALRGGGAEYILCDEIATAQDAASISQAVGAGVRLVASIHGSGEKALTQRRCLHGLGNETFGMAVFLDDAASAGKIRGFKRLL